MAILIPAPTQSQEVTLGSRRFWVGDAPDITLSLNESKWIALNRIDWIETVLSDDPLLSDVLFFIRERFGSKPKDIAAMPAGQVRVPADQLPEKVQSPGV